MRYFTSIVLFLILLLGNNNLAMGIDIDKCYSIDGPANIRETPNGKIMDSLPYGQGVRVKEVQAAWASIEYSRKNKFSCSAAADSITGWTHEKNLRPYAQSLEKLVKDRKVLITAEKNLTFYNDERGELLGEKLRFKGDQHEREDMFGVAVPEHPLIVNIYCLDGKNFENEIRSVEYDMGGDSGVRSVSIRTKHKLPKSPCIFVNGVLESENSKGLMTSVPDNINFCEKAQTERSFCKAYKGDFNNDGIVEVLVNNGWYGAPWASKWAIFQIDNQGNKKELGKVGEDGGP